MLQEFVLVSFASFIGYQIFRYFSFFNLNLRIAPVICILISYVLTWLSHPSWLIAFASTGGVALLNKITEADSPTPIVLPKITVPKFFSKKPWPEAGLPPRQDRVTDHAEQGAGHRIRSL